MREFSKAMPQFWTGKTGKEIRGQKDPQIVAFYLFSCPSSNMIGLYYLPMPTLCHETGLTLGEARKALARLLEVGFATYDEHFEHIWVLEMAAHQIGETLKPKDNRVAGITNELKKYVSSPFFNSFMERYRIAFHQNMSDFPEAPSESLPSKDKETEKEKDILERERVEATPLVTSKTGGNGNHPQQPVAAKVKTTRASKAELASLHPEMELLIWMRKVGTDAGKHWKYSPDYKKNQGPTPGIVSELQQREEQVGFGRLRKWWLGFLRTRGADKR